MVRKCRSAPINFFTADHTCKKNSITKIPTFLNYDHVFKENTPLPFFIKDNVLIYNSYNKLLKSLCLVFSVQQSKIKKK